MFLSLNKISKSYFSQYGNLQRKILNDLNLSVEEGSSVAIVGPSGSGKTTILNLISKLDNPDSGIIEFKGRDLNSLSKKEILKFRSREIGFVFQQHFLLPQCNLLENVLVPGLVNKSSMPSTKKYADKLLMQLGLWDIRHQKPGELSVGECQRAALARALINKPELLLADEPTGSLDEENAMHLADLLVNQNKSEGTSLIVVTHSFELAKRMEHIYELKNGSLHLFQQ